MRKDQSMQMNIVRITAAFSLVGAAAIAHAATTLDNLPPWDTGRGKIAYAADVGTAALSTPLPPWDTGRGKVAPKDVAVAVAPAEPTTVAEVPTTDTVGAAESRNDPCTPIAKSQDAVGHPCETTRSFMQSLGLSEAQMARVERDSVIGSTAH